MLLDLITDALREIESDKDGVEREAEAFLKYVYDLAAKLEIPASELSEK